MQTRKAREGTPRDIVPRYGMSLIIGLDIRLAVVAETAQQVARASMTWWKLHTAYCLQSSGEAECMIRNLTSLRRLFGHQKKSPERESEAGAYAGGRLAGFRMDDS